uniref:Epithelial stromal interaction 1 n=1 Tax=Latimeria chalumnae TaxID=7897 RepID=H3A339_LATCH
KKSGELEKLKCSFSHAPKFSICSGSSYTLIPPNQTKRSQIQRSKYPVVAAKELEELQRWKEEHRPGPINLAPEHLGGSISLAEARKRQQIQHSQSKFQLKAKRDEYRRKEKEAEEAEIQKMKEKQREKANKLVEKQRQEEQQRRKTFAQDYSNKINELQQRVGFGFISGDTNQNPGNSHTVWARSHAYKEMLKKEENRKLQEMLEEERKKVK